MKKRKNLNKRIQRLKDRLAKDARKLAKLTVKLGAAVAGGVGAGKRKAGGRARKGRKAADPTASARRRKVAAPKPKAPVKSAASTGKAAPKAKKKLNITPERRAQLSAAMKARWEAKRAAHGGNTQGGSNDQGSPPPPGSQPS